MATVYAVYNKTTRDVTIRTTDSAAPSGYVKIGSFEHPDETYPDSYVIYHGVRDLLYKRSAADPSQTAMFPNNITDMDKITITRPEVIAVASITLNKTTSTLVVGGTETLTGTVLPANAADKTITWSTSDATKATVNASGQVTAVAAGEVTITATAGGKTATCVYTINAA